jgi:hypothetical protein
MQETSSSGGRGIGGMLSFSQEIATTEVRVKGWVTKIQFQRGRLTREQMQITLWIWFKKAFVCVWVPICLKQWEKFNLLLEFQLILCELDIFSWHT